MAALELVGIDKHFGATHAVRAASVSFDEGRIHAVVGENGAGKSTLLRAAAGLVVPDAGEVRVFGAPLAPHTPAEAIRRGVGMVEQHFALVDVFDVVENVVLGVEPTRGFGRLDPAAARGEIAAIARELGVVLPMATPVGALGVGDRQRVEIVRVLYRRAKILLLDEPTAVLTPAEAEALYATLRRLADGGRAIIVVTHKMDEVRAHADRVTVVRRGEVVETRSAGASGAAGTARWDAADVRAITAAVMGSGGTRATGDGVDRADFSHHGDPGDVGAVSGDVGDLGDLGGGGAARPRRAPGDVVLAARALVVGRALRGVDLEVRAGEIVGVAGVEGNGQRELVHAFAGIVRPDAGAVEMRGDVAVVHEDRQNEGLVLDASLADNVTLGELARYTRFGVGIVDRAAVAREAAERLARGGAPAELDRPARSLSGGNQQKVVLARALGRVALGARALVLSHPTRGVDLGASRAIVARIRAAADAGIAVLLVSADLHELRALADRIVVLARGAIAAELPPTATDAEIGAAMLAVADPAAPPAPPAQGAREGA